VPRLTAHVLAPLAVVVASLALPFVSSGSDAPRTGAATSVVARAAQADADARPADQRFPVGSPALQSARDVARAYWRSDACGGAVEFVWTTMDAGTNATASWRNPTDAWNNAPENFDCRIELNAAAEYDFPKLCTVVAHELGHLLGQQHADRDGQLMSAYYTTPLPACAAAAPAEARPAAAASAKPRAATTTKAKRSTTKRCVVRFKAGKRVRRCTKVAKTAKRATRAKKA
jgi:Matrixin